MCVDRKSNGGGGPGRSPNPHGAAYGLARACFAYHTLLNELGRLLVCWISALLTCNGFPNAFWSPSCPLGAPHPGPPRPRAECDFVAPCLTPPWRSVWAFVNVMCMHVTKKCFGAVLWIHGKRSVASSLVVGCILVRGIHPRTRGSGPCFPHKYFLKTIIDKKLLAAPGSF